jgi:ParB-like chromosome segregation protein Spo0J
MAKRKRLTPLGTGAFPVAEAETDPKQASSATFGRVPIAQVAGDASIAAAFETVRDELQSAQREGRMVLSLPLDAIKADFLIRDRMACDPEEMDALKQSIRQRGQRTPVEVTELGQGRYGLISGWRRLQALGELHEESGGLARFGKVQALLRLPEDRSAAYIAMLEENEVRANLSYYERARIVVLSVDAGVFDSEKKALQSLFSTASFAKRSKVKSFMPLVRALDGVLRFPAQIPERLGLALSRTIGEDPDAAEALIQILQSESAETPEDERAVLEGYQDHTPPPAPGAQKSAAKEKATRTPSADPVAEDREVSLDYRKGRIVLEGTGVDASLKDALQAWLAARPHR